MYLNRYSFDPIIISQAPYQSTIATPNFGTTKMNTLKNFDFVSYQIAKNVNLQFTALEYNMGKNDSFYFMANNQKIKIGKKGDAKTFTNQIVTLYYFCDKNTTVANNGALFQVKTI
uniref:Uncharacterized protein n=1 Tax=Panagrolaimus superbus TaxID=310955 RepID=A0A914Z394_9BILA